MPTANTVMQFLFEFPLLPLLLLFLSVLTLLGERKRNREKIMSPFIFDTVLLILYCGDLFFFNTT